MSQDRYADRILDVAEILANPVPDQDWVVDRFAAPGAVTLVAGSAAVAKSALTVQLACAAEDGRGSAAGIEVRHTPALVVDAEQGPRVIARRLHALREVPPTLSYVYGAGLDVRREDDRRYITELALERETGLIVADSLRRLSPGADENGSTDMVPVLEGFARIAQETDVAVVLIHHRGKGEADFRGTEAIRDVADAMFVLEAVRDDPERLTRRRLRCIKMRLDVEPEDRWMRVEADPLRLVAAAPFRPEDIGAGDDIKSQLRERIVQVLEEQTEPISRPDLFAAVNRGASDGTARAVIDDLSDAGRVVVTRGKTCLYVQLVTAPSAATRDGLQSLHASSRKTRGGCQGGEGAYGTSPLAAPSKAAGLDADCEVAA